jgi:hypothetical protein
LFEDTGLEYGDVLGAASTVVGYECDGCDFTYSDGLPYPTGSDGTPENFVIPTTSRPSSSTGPAGSSAAVIPRPVNVWPTDTPSSGPTRGVRRW